MDSPEAITDETAWRLATDYIDAWNRRDRDAWLELLHPELEFRPSAMVGTRIVYHGLEGANRYFDELVAGERAEQAQITGLRRIAPDSFLIELELLIDGNVVSKACITAQLRDEKFVDTCGYLSDPRMLAETGVIPQDPPVVPPPEEPDSRTLRKGPLTSS